MSNLRYTPTYNSWKAMRQRCRDPHDTRYAQYGGRGVVVCARWDSFENFVADMGVRPKGKTLERNNRNGHYCKENCSWKTPREQANNRTSCVEITYNGKRQNLTQWGIELGIQRGTLYARLRRWGNDPQQLFKELVK